MKRKHYHSLKASGYSGILTQELKDSIKMLQDDVDYEPPGVLKSVNETFWDIRGQVCFDESITYTEIKSYTELMGITLNPIEVRTIIQMDRTFLHTCNRIRSK